MSAWVQWTLWLVAIWLAVGAYIALLLRAVKRDQPAPEKRMGVVGKVGPWKKCGMVRWEMPVVTPGCTYFGLYRSTSNDSGMPAKAVVTHVIVAKMRRKEVGA